MKKTQKEFPLVDENKIKKTLEINYGLCGLILQVLDQYRNTIYKVEHNSFKYIFKIYELDFLSLEEIKGEVELLNILLDNQISVSYPIEDKDHNYVQNFFVDNNEVYGVLFSFAHGRAVSILSNLQLTTVGSELAKLHNITNGLTLKHKRTSYDLIEILKQSIDTLKPAFEGFKDDYLFFREASNKVVVLLENLDISFFSYGYIHFDFLPWNIYFEEDDSITFFDFEIAGKGFLILDLACFYNYYFNIYQLGIIEFEHMTQSLDTFIDAYLSNRKLYDEEISSIPLLGYAHLIYGFKFRYEHLENWGYPDHLKKVIALLRYWMEKHAL